MGPLTEEADNTQEASCITDRASTSEEPLLLRGLLLLCGPHLLRGLYYCWVSTTVGASTTEGASFIEGLDYFRGLDYCRDIF